jgi:hypothetical protein
MSLEFASLTQACSCLILESHEAIRPRRYPRASNSGKWDLEVTKIRFQLERHPSFGRGVEDMVQATAISGF